MSKFYNRNPELVAKFRDRMIAYYKFINPKAFWASSPPAHYKLQKYLLDPTIKRLNVIFPRGLAKSTIAAEGYPLYHIFMEELPNDQPKLVIICSKTLKHAKDRLAAIKTVIEHSVQFKAMHGFQGEGVAKKWTEEFIQFADGSAIMAKGTGQQIRGVKIDYVRPTLIIGDDLEDENNTSNEDAMSANLDWLLAGTDYTLDDRFGKVVVIGTPLHQLCVVEKLSDMLDWTTIRESYLKYKEDGTPYSIWSDKKPVETLLADKEAKEHAGKGYVWYMETQCQVIGGDNQLFTPDMIKYYKGDIVRQQGENGVLRIYEIDKVKLDEPEELLVNVYSGVDPASSQNRKADYSVIFSVAVDKDGRIFCLPYFRKRVKPMDLAAAIVQNYKTYKPLLTNIETTGYQEMLRDYLKKEVQYIPGLERKNQPRSPKNKRIEGLEPYFRAGKVYLLDNMGALIEELLAFPLGKHDDSLDGLWYALQRYSRPQQEEVLAKETVTDSDSEDEIDSWYFS